LIDFSPIREVAKRIDEYKQKGIEIINFSIGRPDFDTPAHIKDAAKEALDKGLVHYTNSAGTLELREALCARMKKDFNLDTAPDEVIFTSGATEAIYVALQSILDPGDEVIVPEPMYVYYNGWCRLCGAEPVNIPLKESEGFNIDCAEIESKISPNTKAIILTSPHNPTGQVYSVDTIKAIADLAIKHNLMVIADDIYNYIIYDDMPYVCIASLEGMKQRTLVVGSFSKSYAMDGWRLGYLLGPREIISNCLKLHQHMVSCPNTFVQIGAVAALTSSQDCVREMVKEFGRRRGLLLTSLDSIGFDYVKPKGAFYIFPSIKKYGRSSKEMAEYLLEEARVATVPGTAFGPTGEGYIRISYAASYEDIEKGMRQIKSALAKL
jgi:aspartate/methionine/tyrosine aminotransferase